MKFVKYFALISAFILLVLSSFSLTKAQSQEELQQKIDEYTAQIVKLQSQSKTLSNQIAQYDTQIKLTSLKIQQTQEKISQLGGRIDQLEGSLVALTKAYSSRVVETYKMGKVADPILTLLSAKDLKDAVIKFHYLQQIQIADEELLKNLQTTQNNYKIEKTGQEELQAELNKEQNALAAQKRAKANLLSVTKNDEKKYQDLLSQAKAQLAAFRRFTSSQGGASILSGQTKCDDWGCYYNQRDALWGNQLIGNSNISVAEVGCLITSMSMVISHYKGSGSIKPSDIASNSSVFFGDTAYMIQGSWSVNGVSTTRTRVCTWCGIDSLTSKMDEELNAGRPVIVGLYSGPDHFIVIKRKDGGNYIMNDPFLENGGNRNLTEKYQLTDIKTLDIVRVN